MVVRSRGNLKNRTSNWMKSIRSGSDRDLWFALLREDERIDDTTFINKVERGSFRLHPAGSSGNSDGCITLVSLNDYMVLWRALVRTPSTMITPQLRAFGTIQVY
ncbi:tlde1 domain-containing protein [Enterobacter cloacae]|uniref:tlde1 domain-containing protein n=1 Tax=Enterobacter cloacae TaxID=550 RepID=UPI00373FE155